MNLPRKLSVFQQASLTFALIAQAVGLLLAIDLTTLQAVFGKAISAWIVAHSLNAGFVGIMGFMLGEGILLFVVFDYVFPNAPGEKRTKRQRTKSEIKLLWKRFVRTVLIISGVVNTVLFVVGGNHSVTFGLSAVGSMVSMALLEQILHAISAAFGVFNQIKLWK